MSRFQMPVDSIHVTYAGEKSTYLARRMTRAQYEAVDIAQGAARAVADPVDRTIALDRVAVETLARHIVEVRGPAGDQYPADEEGRVEWWRELRTYIERIRMLQQLVTLVVGDPLLLSLGRGPAESEQR